MCEIEPNLNMQIKGINVMFMPFIVYSNTQKNNKKKEVKQMKVYVNGKITEGIALEILSDDIKYGRAYITEIRFVQDAIFIEIEEV